MLDRVGIAEELLDGSGDQARGGAQPGHLGGVIQQSHEPVADQVHRRLEAGDQQERAQRHHLRRPDLVGRDERADQVVGRVVAA